MRKLKLLFTGLALIGGVLTAHAQTDVTSTYLTNADFSQTTALTGTYLYGYGKDGSPYGYQTVDGWTSVVTKDAGDSYSGSGTAAGVFSYGSSTQLKGNAKAAPATNPNGETSGNCFGFFGVWGCGGYYYQDVTLAAGKYTITVPMYNQSGTQATTTTYTGFFPTSGTNRTVAVNPTVGQWVNQTVTFTLADETAGQIRIGYQSAGNGSASNPMLFIDCVKIEFTAIVVKDVLSTALTAATNANATLNSSDLAAAITTAQGVYDDENATQEQVNNAAATLNTAVELAMSAAGDVTAMFITNADMSSTDGWTAYVSSNFNDLGSYPIGGTSMVRFAAPTADDDHLDSEYAFGFECRWDPNWASYYQETPDLPAGVYTLTFDVENVNENTTNATYDNLFYLQEGSNKVTDSAKEWMQGKTSWTTHTIHITLNEAAPLKISLGYGSGGNNFGANNTPALYVSHLKLNYSSFLAGAKAAYDEAVAAAEAARDNDDYENVTGSERTDLLAEIAKAEPTTVDGYNDAAAALTSATQAFVAAKAAYDGLAALWNNGVPELVYALTEKYTAIGDAYFGEGDVVNAADAEERTAAMKTAIRAYYESHALAEKVEGAVNYADAITGANPEVNTGWTGGIGTDNRSWEMYTDASGNAGGRYYDGGWSQSAAANINMSREISLPAGTYLLTVTARGSENLTSYTMSVAGESVNLPRNGSGENVGVFGHGWDDVSLEFESNGNPVTLTIAANSTEYQQWISFNRFRLVRLSLNTSVYAGETEYNALNNAISDAEAKTLGFEDGQYAPYNNVAALEALAVAKAIDQTAELTNFKTDVEDATTALTGATWAANDGDVDAIFNGTFAETGTGSNPKGWTRSNNGWGQQVTGLTSETNGVADGTTTAWYYNNNGAWQYGNDGVYTMPLASNQAYELTFKYSKHGSDGQNWMKASVVNSENEGLEVTQFAAADNSTNYVTAKAYFTTGAAGNYILSIEQNGNAHLTDVSLVKTALTTKNISEEAAAVATDVQAFYETVTLTRTLSASYWNTFSVPFDAEIPTDWAVKEFDSATDNVITFKDATTIVAGKPYLVNVTADVENPTFNNVIVKNTEGLTDGEGDYQFAAQIYNKSLATDGTIAYLATDGKIKKLNTANGLKGLRAYFIIPAGAEARIAFLDGETTGISTMHNAQCTMQNEVFDLQGRKVKSMKKGIYVVNGKKVIK